MFDAANVCRWSRRLKKELKSKHKEFEDAIQIISACSIEKLDYIVTRNIKDFKGAEISVLTPDELISKVNTIS